MQMNANLVSVVRQEKVLLTARPFDQACRVRQPLQRIIALAGDSFLMPKNMFVLPIV